MIAAVLTILGYSINGTIIVFDRIRENRKLMTKDDFGTIANTSMWQTMARNINTAATVAIVLLLLCIMGVASVRNFALPILIGVVAGAYSDIFISGNLWYLFERNKKRPI
jgi:preprotein translocase SecF subunit